MESAPQSTINHNAVIELASDLRWPHARPRHLRRTLKKKARLPKKGPQIGPDHAKIDPPAQRRYGQKPAFFKLPKHRFSRGILGSSSRPERLDRATGEQEAKVASRRRRTGRRA